MMNFNRLDNFFPKILGVFQTELNDTHYTKSLNSFTKEF